MKAVKVFDLFGIIPNWEYRGQEYVFTYKGELYMPLNVANNIHYIIHDDWIEEINNEN